MSLEKAVRNTLRIVVTQSRRLLEEAIGELLQGQFGIHASGKVEDAAAMGHLSAEDHEHREQILIHLEHIKATGFKPGDAIAQLVREVAFTHLNRLCAYKMMETRGLIRESVSRGLKSRGFLFYLAEHSADEQLWSSGRQDIAYRHFLAWLGGTLSAEIGVLFSPHDSANRLFPPHRVLEQVLELLNSEELKKVWAEDETIGWVYQYFTPKELRDQVRKESQAPRNSYELAFRNQFYTPRYVVQFLTDNTLGRTWYEMRQGKTRLKEQCTFLICRPDEIFLAEVRSPEVADAQRWLQGEDVPEPDLWLLAHTVNGYKRAGEFGDESSQWMKERLPRLTHDGAKELKTQELLDLLFLFCRYERFSEGTLDSLRREIEVIMYILRERVQSLNEENRSQEELLRAPFYISYRPMKDPREIRILDPACGSGHFLLYCFDLLDTIYEEAYNDSELGPALQRDYATLAELKKAVPGLILANNLHGIDIDLRATQIAALALWLRAQRAYQQMGLKNDERPRITRSNIVCAEPMPGEKDLLAEFTRNLRPIILGDLVRTIFSKMQLASEAGSLLNIEDEIKEAVREAKDQWLLRPRGEQLALWPEQHRHRSKQLAQFDETQITTREFWDGAEAQVIDALHRYARDIANGKGLARQLFTDDAVQGFAFIDICQKRFNVVLMNPPYGRGSDKFNLLLQERFPRSKNDLYAAFVEDGLRRLQPGGFLGALTGRNGFVHSALSEWRKELLINHSFTDVADLGAGVLDSAFVETAAYIIEAKPSSAQNINFIDLRNEDYKADTLHLSLQNILLAHKDVRFFLRPSAFFVDIPRTPLIYRATARVKDLFTSGSRFESDIGQARLGLRTLHDFQYIRLAWEVHPKEIGWKHYWVYLNKGGSFSRFYFDFHLLLNWDNNGAALKGLASAKYGSETRIIQAQSFYGLAGLTYPRRSLKGFSVRVLPANCIFTDKGTSIFLREKSNLLLWLGILNSNLVAACVELQSGSASYEVGYIQRLPSFQLPYYLAEEITRAVEDVLTLKRELSSMLEISRYFISPWKNSIPESLQAMSRQIVLFSSSIENSEVRAIQCADANLAAALGLNDEDEQALADILAQRDKPLPLESDDSEDEELGSSVLPSESAKDVLGYAMGAIFARWDIRIALNVQYAPKLSNPFHPLPSCSPGMLVGLNGLPATSGHIVSEEWLRSRTDANTLPEEGKVDQLTIPDEQYPIKLNWEGIMVDDPDHPNDIVCQVRDVLRVIWQDRAESIEQEACQLLNVKDLRDYFRRPGNDGFWVDHVKRYSKSRRKAPIYWLLQSSKRNYALWLYYHRLDKDIFFKALTSYVEPKLRLEEGRLAQLRTLLAGAGNAGRDARQLEKQLERQVGLMAELYDFRDKFRRAADLQLVPDLNDGVVLNIAPLWELVPWSEARRYWEELQEGKYEWSSISKQLHERKGI